MEEARREHEKLEGKSELHEVEGGDYEMVSLSSPPPSDSALPTTDDLSPALRPEAYAWPRLVAPPLKRSGHVVMDACCPNGERISLARGQS